MCSKNVGINLSVKAVQESPGIDKNYKKTYNKDEEKTNG